MHVRHASVACHQTCNVAIATVMVWYMSVQISVVILYPTHLGISKLPDLKCIHSLSLVIAIGYEHVMFPWQWEWRGTCVCKVSLSCTLLLSSYKLEECKN